MDDEILYGHLVSIILGERKARGISQVELASRLGKPQSFVSKVENRQRRLDPIQMFRICAALDMRASDVMRAVEEIEGSRDTE